LSKDSTQNSSVAARSNSLLKSTAVMGSATFLSRILGLVREQLMAGVFGASGLTDAFLVAYRIPNLLRDLFAEGAFSSAFVPVLTEVKENEGPEKARSMFWSLFFLLLLITGFFAVSIIVFAPELINLFAPSFKADPEKFKLATELVQIMAPYLVLVSVAALFMGGLNTAKVFFLPALAPAFFNIAMILSMLILPTVLIAQGHYAIFALGIGVILGGFSQMLLQVFFLKKHGLGFKLPKEILTEKTKKVLILLGPGLIGFAATQLNLIVNTILASGTVVGAVSWLSYAFRLFHFPVGIVNVPLGNSHLVHFSQAWKKGERNNSLAYLTQSYNSSWMVMSLATALLLALAPLMVQVVFEHGKFTSFDTEQTSLLLRLYAIGLPFYGLYKIFVPSFYTLDLQKIPVRTSVVSVLINIVFCLSLTETYSFPVLALGTSLSMILNVGTQGFLLGKRLEVGPGFYFTPQVFKSIFSAVLVTAATRYSYQGLAPALSGFFHQALALGLLILGSSILYMGLLYILGERKIIQEIRTRIVR